MLLIKMQSYALKLGAPRPLISNPTCRVARVIDPEYANGADGGGAFDGWLCIKGTTGANNRKNTNAAAAPTKNSIRIGCFRIDKTCILPFIRFPHRHQLAALVTDMRHPVGATSSAAGLFISSSASAVCEMMTFCASIATALWLLLSMKNVVMSCLPAWLEKTAKVNSFDF